MKPGEASRQIPLVTLWPGYTYQPQLEAFSAAVQPVQFVIWLHGGHVLLEIGVYVAGVLVLEEQVPPRAPTVFRYHWQPVWLRQSPQFPA